MGREVKKSCKKTQHLIFSGEVSRFMEIMPLSGGGLAQVPKKLISTLERITGNG